MTGPEICASALACIHEFQTLIAAILAGAAALVAATVAWRAANLPIVTRERLEQEASGRRLQHQCLVLTSQLQTLQRRARAAESRITVHISADLDVTDETKEKAYLAVPAAIENWEVMSFLPSDITDRLLDLTRAVEDHNFDIARVEGSFGAKDFQESVLGRLDGIKMMAKDLASRTTIAARKTTCGEVPQSATG